MFCLADEDLDDTIKDKILQTLLDIERPQNIDLFHKEQTGTAATVGPLTEMSDLLSSQSFLIITRLDIKNKDLYDCLKCFQTGSTPALNSNTYKRFVEWIKNLR